MCLNLSHRQHGGAWRPRRSVLQHGAAAYRKQVGAMWTRPAPAHAAHGTMHAACWDPHGSAGQQTCGRIILNAGLTTQCSRRAALLIRRLHRAKPTCPCELLQQQQPVFAAAADRRHPLAVKQPCRKPPAARYHPIQTFSIACGPDGTISGVPSKAALTPWPSQKLRSPLAITKTQKPASKLHPKTCAPPTPPGVLHSLRARRHLVGRPPQDLHPHAGDQCRGGAAGGGYVGGRLDTVGVGAEARGRGPRQVGRSRGGGPRVQLSVVGAAGWWRLLGRAFQYHSWSFLELRHAAQDHDSRAAGGRGGGNRTWVCCPGSGKTRGQCFVGWESR